MSAVLFVAPEGSAAHELYRSCARSGSAEPPTLLTDLEAVAEVLQGRRWHVLALDAAFSVDDMETVLRQTARSHPAVVRLVLCGPGQDPGQINGAQHVLPCTGEWSQLEPVLRAGHEVSQQLAGNERLARLVAKLDKLPSPPMLYFDLRAELAAHEGNLEGLARITERDPGLVAQVMKIANSGFYAVPRTVTHLDDAIRLLGSDTLLSLVLAAHVFSGMPPPGMRLEVLWQHSARVASLARQIAAVEGHSRTLQGASATAGLLHDIGLLVLLENDASVYQPMWKQAGGDETRLAEGERATYGLTHGELGGLVLNLWTLPTEIVEAVASSHRWETPTNAPVTQAVMTAEWLLGPGRNLSNPHLELPGFLSRTTRERLASWIEVRDEMERNVA